MADRIADFTGLEYIQLPVSLSPRKGKYYGTEIVDARGAEVLRLWEHEAGDVPSEREKESFGPDWSEQTWSEYCCDSHWECQSDYLLARFIVKALNFGMNPVYIGSEGVLKYGINRFSVARSDIDNPEEEFRTWREISGDKRR